MTDLPPLAVLMTTYAGNDHAGKVRRAEAAVALMSWARFLRYDGQLSLIIEDDESTYPGYPFDLVPVWQAEHIRSHDGAEPLRPFVEVGPGNVGASLNRGMRAAARFGSPVWFYGVDDWVLREPLDVTPWVRFLLDDERYGVVRLFPHPNIAGQVEHVQHPDVEHILRLNPAVGYAYATRPMLVHERFHAYYGDFEQFANAFEVEDKMTRAFAIKGHTEQSPRVGLALPTWFAHESSIEYGYGKEAR